MSSHPDSRSPSPSAISDRGLIIAAGSCTAFFAVLAAVVPDQGPALFDQSVLSFLFELRSETWTTAMLAITRIGDGLVVTALTFVVVGLLARHSKITVLFVIASVAGAALLNVLAKFSFGRERPTEHPPVEFLTSYSFPSGHSMATMAFFFAVFLVSRRLWPNVARASLSIGVLLTLAVGLSRMYLGVHYPTDVAAGWVLAFAWVLLHYLWYRRYVPHQRPLT